MKLPIFQLDAFTNLVFSGNPAAVVVMTEWLSDQTLQAIAAENNCSETAFVIPGDESFGLRWFTPDVEVDLCGHATLATAHVVFEHGYTKNDEIHFQTSGGSLSVRREGDLLAMNFPARPPRPIDCGTLISQALGAVPRELHEARDLLAVFGSQEEVDALNPDYSAIAELDTFAVIVTAVGNDCDFVSRFFAPGAGIPEDAATGSAHCTLVPYWSRRLAKSKLHALQISRRGGEFFCEHRGERVVLAGRVVEYLRGEIYV